MDYEPRHCICHRGKDQQFPEWDSIFNIATFNLQAEKFSVGDVVRVIDDIAKVHTLLENHGGWVDDIALVG